MLALLHEAVNSARWVLRGRHHGHVGHLHHNSRVDAVINVVYSCLRNVKLSGKMQGCREAHLMLAHCVRHSRARCA